MPLGHIRALLSAVMKWLNPHSVCFVVGLIVTVVGVFEIYRPAAAIAAGVILMAISVVGGRNKGAEP